MQGLWPDECANSNYDNLNILACLSCDPKQPKYTSIEQEEDPVTGEMKVTKKIVRVCRSVIEGIYGQADLDTPTTKFDECGAWEGQDTVITPIDEPPEGWDPSQNGWAPDWKKGYILSTPDDKLIYPGKSYGNAYEFFSGFGQVSIPFMDGFEI